MLFRARSQAATSTQPPPASPKAALGSRAALEERGKIGRPSTYATILSHDPGSASTGGARPREGHGFLPPRSSVTQK